MKKERETLAEDNLVLAGSGETRDGKAEKAKLNVTVFFKIWQIKVKNRNQKNISSKNKFISF